MLYFKSCLRCKDGTVELGSDSFGSFLSCITCGYTINSRSIRSDGSIAQPTTIEDDYVKMPGLALVAMAEEFDEIDDDDDDFEPEIDLFDEEFAELNIEVDQAAAM